MSDLTRDENHIYRVDGAIIPGVTEILSVLGDYSFVKDRDREFGTIVHDTVRLYDKDDLGSYDKKLEHYLTSWEEFKQKYRVRVLHSELKLYSSIYKFAGEPDKIAMVGDEWAVIDIKTGKPANYVGLQLAAYAIMVEERFGVLYRKIKRISVYLDGETYYRKVHTGKNDKQEFLTLLYARNIINRYGSNTLTITA